MAYTGRSTVFKWRNNRVIEGEGRLIACPQAEGKFTNLRRIHYGSKLKLVSMNMPVTIARF